nr:sorting nexin-41 [Quercus suber]
MWDDEDNNPYGSFHRRDSEASEAQSPDYAHPSTPPSGRSSPLHPPGNTTRSTDLSDEELDDDRPKDQKVQPKEGGYDSRIEQILYEHPELEIQIVYAGKNTEGGGGFITYTIRTGEIEVRRRYSEFASLRQTLTNLHPTLIIPPIPEKHSIADYAAKPTKAKEDVGIIELRQRMLATFLNRCRRMKEVRDDGVWWRFLDPNVSWNEVLHSYPAANIPKNNLKAPPLDPANPTPGHSHLPVPSQNAKLRSSSSTSFSGTPSSPPASSIAPSAAAHTTPQIQYIRFPSSTQDLSESDLDPYFSSFESSSKDLETLLTGSMEKVNQRLLRHMYSLGDDLMDLGARYNAFSLSEQSQSVAHAIEKAGQACDFTYIQSRDLSSGLSAGFAEPMRESAQFAGVVRSVLKYRVLKRVQEEMTRDELEKKKNSLEQLERSEMEAKRIEQYMTSSGMYNSSPGPRRSASNSSNRERTTREEDNTSVDSDFPPGQANHQVPTASQGAPQQKSYVSPPSSPPNGSHKRGTSGVANKLFGRLSGFTHAIQGATDQDPERARRDQLGKTKESLSQLEQALEVAQKDVKDASAGVLQDLKRFQRQKEEDLRTYMLNFAKCHIAWSMRSLDEWEKAKEEIDKIEVRTYWTTSLRIGANCADSTADISSSTMVRTLRATNPGPRDGKDVQMDQGIEEDGHTLQFDEPLTWRAGKPIAVSELLRRLRTLFRELANMDQQDTDSQALTPKAQELANTMLLNHKDKGVRAWTLACIVEMFRITAPNAPYKPGQLRAIFELFVSSVIPHLASPADPYSQQYLSILSSLTTVKSIVLLTDVPNSDLLILQLFQNCFDVVSGNVKGAQGEQLPKNIEYHMTNMLATLVEECSSLPTGVDECILAQFLRADPNMVQGDQQPSTTLREASPAYNMARSICNQASERMTRAIGQYFSSVLVNASQNMSRVKQIKGKGTKRSYDESEEDMDDGLLTPPGEEDLREIEAAHRLLRELWRSCPDTIQNVIPQIQAEAAGQNPDLRAIAVLAIGDMIAGIGAAGPPPSPPMDPAAYPSQSEPTSHAKGSQIVTLQPHAPRAFSSVHPVAYQACFDRINDKSAQVRSATVTAAARVLTTSAGGKGLATEQEDDLLSLLSKAMQEPDDKVRLAAVQAIGMFDYNNVVSKLCKFGGVSTDATIISRLADRVKDTKRNIRIVAMDTISRIWGVAAGAIRQGNGHARELFGAIPSRILDAHFVNSRDVNASIYRVMYDALLPFGFPPTKTKSGQSSQRIDDLQDDQGMQEHNPDAIRTERILTLVRDLDEKGMKVFYALQAQQPRMAKYMERYLAACEDLKNATSQKEAKQVLDKCIPPLVKPLADEQIAVEHMLKFANHYDRRNYQLIRFCISPESDYRKITKALRELTKRLQEGPSGLSAILETLIPVVKMVSILVYNKSHVPVIMKRARDDDFGFGTAANDLLNQISTHAPDVFKGYVHELCNDLKTLGPTSEHTQDYGAAHTLKACAGFAKRTPADMPKDRDFLKTLVTFAKYGSPPETAKQAVTVLVASADKKQMYIKDLLKYCLIDFDVHGEHSLAKLATLSQLKLVAHKEVEDQSDAIMDVAANVLGGINNITAPVAHAETDVDLDLASKLWALKLLVNDVRGQDTAGNPRDAFARISAAADRVYRLLNTLIAEEGELSKHENTATPESHKVALRLAAGIQILKLSCNRVTDQKLTPCDFNRLAQLTQDPKESVRTSFGNALKKYLGQRRLTTRYYALTFLYAFEPAKAFKRATETWLKSGAARDTAANSQVIESAFPRLLSLLAHHQDFDPEDVDEDIVEYIVFFLRNVANEANLPMLFNIAERLKTVQDAINPDESQRLYIVSDLAQATIRAFQDHHGWSLQLTSTKARLPSGIFAPLQDHDMAQEIAETRYAPNKLMEKVEEIVKGCLSTKKRNKPVATKRRSDGQSAQPAKKMKHETSATKSGTRKLTKPKTAKTLKKTSLVEQGHSSERRKSTRTSSAKNYAESDSDDADEDIQEWQEANSEGDNEGISSTPPTSDPVHDPASFTTQGAKRARKAAPRIAPSAVKQTRHLPSREVRARTRAAAQDVDGVSSESDELSEVPSDVAD